MACVDCFSNCGDNRTTDRCVQYTGVDVPLLGICNGDTLYQVEVIVLEKLQALADGTGINLEDLTIDCDFINDLIAGETDLASIIQALITASCTLRDLLQDVEDVINAPITFNAPCLSLSDEPTRDEVLAAVAAYVCSLNTRVATIENDYVKASELCDLVTECLSDTSGIQEYTKMPKYVALPYHGSLSVFDSSGSGITAQGYSKVYICLGQTINSFTLPDYRGRTPVGANIGLPGGAMDSSVDPSLPANAGYNISTNVKKGTFTHTLSSTEGPSHTHGITDPGHLHNITYKHGQADQNESGTSGDLLDNSGTQDRLKATNTATTGITISSAGGGQPHNNMQPSVGCVFIMYVP